MVQAIEAQFELAGITADSTKYNHVVSTVESNILSSVGDRILQPPPEGEQETINKILIDLPSESEEYKIRALLQGLDLGDFRPSQLLTQMRSLAGTTVGEPLLKSMWISQLPTNTQSILAALNQNLQQLATIDDKIADLRTPQVNLATNQNSISSRLQNQIYELTENVNKLNELYGAENVQDTTPAEDETAVVHRGADVENIWNRMRIYVFIIPISEKKLKNASRPVPSGKREAESAIAQQADW